MLYTLYHIEQIHDHGPQPDKGWIPPPGQRGVTAPSRGVQVSKEILHRVREENREMDLGSVCSTADIESVCFLPVTFLFIIQFRFQPSPRVMNFGK